MELYKREKVNPAAGCLPILIQMPFFLAFYWVLLESVEMRQAPFALWITDLSTKDPFFILPLIMGAAMFFQQKLNPQVGDPVQVKVMQIMPIIFTGFFAFFPSGPGALLGNQHAVVDCPAMEDQQGGRERGQATQGQQARQEARQGRGHRATRASRGRVGCAVSTTGAWRCIMAVAVVSLTHDHAPRYDSCRSHAARCRRRRYCASFG